MMRFYKPKEDTIKENLMCGFSLQLNNSTPFLSLLIAAIDEGLDLRYLLSLLSRETIEAHKLKAARYQKVVAWLLQQKQWGYKEISQKN